MDFVGKSVRTFPSTTGWNVLYPEAVLQTLLAKLNKTNEGRTPENWTYNAEVTAAS